MDASSIACRYRFLLDEIKRRMSGHGKWVDLPRLLDELHAVRCEYRAVTR